MKETIEDLEWLREQVTVMEVNFARVHNVSTICIALVFTRLMVAGFRSGMSKGQIGLASIQKARADPFFRRREKQAAQGTKGLVASGKSDKDESDDEE
jgi:hypothetical protein